MITTKSGIVLDTLLRWRKPVEVKTRRGQKIVRKAKPSEEFWALWRDKSDELSASGVTLSKWNEEWEVSWWQDVPPEVLVRRQRTVEMSHATDANIVIPKPDGLEYIPFQRAGVAFCMERPGAIIGDEMGLGKTIQAIGTINALPEIKTVLVITKSTLKRNWYRELKKWLVRPLTVEIADADIFPSTDVVVINYDILHKYQSKLQRGWDMCIVDEAHYLKNRKARRTVCVIGHKATPKERGQGVQHKPAIPATRKIMLTGTPIENSTEELWTLLNFIAPEQFASYWYYVKRYCGIENNGFGYKVGNGANTNELQQMLRQDYMIRRLKKDVLKELPPKTRIIVQLEPDGATLKQERIVWGQYEDSMTELQAKLELAKASETHCPTAMRMAFSRQRPS